MGVEPTGDAERRRPPVLKTGTITGPHALPLPLAVFQINRFPRRLTRALLCVTVRASKTFLSEGRMFKSKIFRRDFLGAEAMLTPVPSPPERRLRCSKPTARE